ncbi:MAG: hypothetical protein ACR2FH_10785 [Caulobacteraceae bacterium]
MMPFLKTSLGALSLAIGAIVVLSCLWYGWVAWVVAGVFRLHEFRYLDWGGFFEATVAFALGAGLILNGVRWLTRRTSD